MKIVFNQSQKMTSFKLIPENLKESSGLIRLALNAKKEKPFQLFYSVSDEPFFYIDLLTVDEKNKTRFIEKKWQGLCITRDLVSKYVTNLQTHKTSIFPEW